MVFLPPVENELVGDRPLSSLQEGDAMERWPRKDEGASYLANRWVRITKHLSPSNRHPTSRVAPTTGHHIKDMIEAHGKFEAQREAVQRKLDLHRDAKKKGREKILRKERKGHDMTKRRELLAAVVGQRCVQRRVRREFMHGRHAQSGHQPRTQIAASVSPRLSSVDTGGSGSFGSRGDPFHSQAALCPQGA